MSPVYAPAIVQALPRETAPCLVKAWQQKAWHKNCVLACVGLMPGA
jgi:hypothetical protein